MHTDSVHLLNKNMCNTSLFANKWMIISKIRKIEIEIIFHVKKTNQKYTTALYMLISEWVFQ